MELEQIKDTKCPDCGCTDITEVRKFNRHISGRWNEMIKFGCERTMTYSPNVGHGKGHNEHACTRSAEALAKEQVKKNAVDSLDTLMKKHDLNISDVRDMLWILEDRRRG